MKQITYIVLLSLFASNFNTLAMKQKSNQETDHLLKKNTVFIDKKNLVHSAYTIIRQKKVFKTNYVNQKLEEIKNMFKANGTDKTTQLLYTRGNKEELIQLDQHNFKNQVRELMEKIIKKAKNDCSGSATTATAICIVGPIYSLLFTILGIIFLYIAPIIDTDETNTSTYFAHGLFIFAAAMLTCCCSTGAWATADSVYRRRKSKYGRKEIGELFAPLNSRTQKENIENTGSIQ